MGSKLFKAFIILFVLALVGWLLYYFAVGKIKERNEKKSSSSVPDRLYTVKRGDLAIGMKFSGNVNSRNKHKMSLEAAFQTKLLWIIDENSKVKKGDVIAKFETEELDEKIETLKFDLDAAEKEIMIAVEEQKILDSTNKAQIRSSEDKVREAEDDCRKYFKFEKQKERDKLDIAIQKAEKSLDEAKKAYNEKLSAYTNKSFNKQTEEAESKKQLAVAYKEVEKGQTEVKSAEQDRKVFKRYDLQDKITELDNKLEQARLNLEKVRVETNSSNIQKNKNLKNLELKKKKIEQDLEKYLSYIPMMTLNSPVDGVVIYGDIDQRWGKIDVKVGMDIRRKQVLLTIPDMSDLVVEFDLPEQYRSRARVGDRVVITPESIKGMKLEGTLQLIASLPVNQVMWDSNSPKIYKSIIDLKTQEPRLVTGMSVDLEVITKELKNVVFIPVEAVFEEGGAYYVYKKTPMKQRKLKIEIGPSNDDYVTITSGLNEGDVVYLYMPFRSNQEG
ncbi:MAG: hypothetical protein A2020_11495 [Lentisphaerae bacterium GWF2_45_14]|nr:MAG: hypothetical protein A2020_11495 [Lentisphaerae bacterium GWF2_45_14]